MTCRQSRRHSAREYRAPVGLSIRAVFASRRHVGLPVGLASAAGRASRPVRRRSRRFAYPMFRDRHQLLENTRRRSDASPDRGRIIPHGMFARDRRRRLASRRKEFLMANKMLIDASHPEETRVVVLRGNRVEEFDFEAADKRPLRGNIYLAKVTRVEPSLQAAFVDYGGNRHGFLAFSEIHPDYYQIPVADRIGAARGGEPRPSAGGRGAAPAGGRRRSRRRNSDGAEKRARADEVISESAPESEEGAEIEAADEAATVDAAAPAEEARAESAEPEIDARRRARGCRGAGVRAGSGRGRADRRRSAGLRRHRGRPSRGGSGRAGRARP